jgi:hypothetical protein
MGKLFCWISLFLFRPDRRHDRQLIIVSLLLQKPFPTSLFGASAASLGASVC